MFDLNAINQELEKYNKYTSYNLPLLQNVEHDESTTYYGEIRKDEILSGNFTIHLSNSIYECTEEFQKSVLWHEFTHIYDILQYKEYPQKDLEGIMKSYSEAHAESIQLRYLLHMTPKQILNQGVRYVNYKTGKESLSVITSEYINMSIQSLTNFQISKSPQDFNSFTNNFFYFCGYMLLWKRENADKLAFHIISSYPKYKDSLKMLYQSIMDEQYTTVASIYNTLKVDAMLHSIPDIK